MTQTAAQVLSTLLEEKPRFHGREAAGSKSYAIQPDVLEWIVANVPAGATTLETGCGYSTIVFTALLGRHAVISPFDEEHELLRSWCREHDLGTDHVDYHPQPSQDVLPSLPERALDFALIDGDHAFPAPFLDWYYVAEWVKKGGYLVVDDTQIPTGGILRDFLAMETERWRAVVELGKTSIFERITDEPVAKGIAWADQPFLKVEHDSFVNKLKRKVSRLGG